MVKIILKVISPFFGKRYFQFFFKGLYYIGIKGMNYGNPNINTNGEMFLLKKLRKDLVGKDQRLVIFDVGANVGEYSLLISKVFKDFNFELFAFEPSLETYKFLSKNVSIVESIHPVNKALGNEAGKMTLYGSKDNDELASLFQRDVLVSMTDNKMTKEEIEVSTIDLFCQTNKINHIHFLKIDVEGNELNVLKGARRMLSENRIGTIQFEFGGTAIDSKIFINDFIKLLSCHGYSMGRILRNGIDEYNNYTIYREVFDFANYLAWKKGN